VDVRGRAERERIPGPGLLRTVGGHAGALRRRNEDAEITGVGFPGLRPDRIVPFGSRKPLRVDRPARLSAACLWNALPRPD
jgi:hypothetical protein